MEKNTEIYSREWDDEFEGIPRKHYSDVDLRDICIPLDDCEKVKLGSIGSELCDRLESNRWDQAPVEVPTDPVGWRLISIQRLRELSQNGLPVTSAPENFLQDDQLAIESRLDFGFGEIPTISVLALFKSFLTRSATIVFCEKRSRHMSLEEVFGGTSSTQASANEEYEEIVKRVIFGLVTRADLNGHPVRAAIYSEVARLESCLARMVREEYKDPWDWIKLLNEKTQSEVFGYYEVGRRNGLERDHVSATTLAHLLTVIEKSPKLLERLGYDSRKDFENRKGQTADIRNCVMHPVRPLVLGPDDILAVIKVLQFVEDLCCREKDKR